MMHPCGESNGFWSDHVQVGEVVYPAGSTFGPRIQSNLQLVLLHSGEMNLRIDDILHHVPAHHVCVLFPAHQEHFTFAKESETHHTYVHAFFSPLSPHLQQRLERLPWPLQLSPTMHQLMRDALHIQATPFPTGRELLQNVISQMFWRYLGEGEQHARQATQAVHPAISQAQSYIWNHLDEPLTLEILASQAAVSPPHLIRLFQAQLHTTPMNYLWERRVARGVELLEQTGLTVGTIAARCGFQSRYHFSRKIRQMVGYSPLEIRQRSWQR